MQFIHQSASNCSIYIQIIYRASHNLGVIYMTCLWETCLAFWARYCRKANWKCLSERLTITSACIVARFARCGTMLRHISIEDINLKCKHFSNKRHPEQYAYYCLSVVPNVQFNVLSRSREQNRFHSIKSTQILIMQSLTGFI